MTSPGHHDFIHSMRCCLSVCTVNAEHSLALIWLSFSGSVKMCFGFKGVLTKLFDGVHRKNNFEQIGLDMINTYDSGITGSNVVLAKWGHPFSVEV